MRKALVVGIDHYLAAPSLHGCVTDAHNMKSALDRHGDGSVNFGVRLLTGTGPADTVSRAQLREGIQALFADDCDIALLYFAGHGYIDSAGGYLCTSETADGHDGLSLNDILQFANESKAKTRMIILDSCHSGIAGTPRAGTGYAELREGITVMTASTADQYATEKNGSGVFTTLFVDALNGGAANLVGDVTPGSVYAHIDQSLGPWEQRPVFKTNVKSFVSLREVAAPIPLGELRRLPEFFPNAGDQLPLDPTFEPERGPSEQQLPEPDPNNTAKFAVLQRYSRVGLVVPVDAPHMWHAAMKSKGCKLTVLGEHYRQLVQKDRI